MIQFKSCTEYLFASKKCLILKGHVMFSWNVLAVGPGHWCHPCHPFVISLWNHAKPSSCRRRWPAVSSWRINRRCSIFLAVSFRSSTRTRKIRQVFSISLSKFLGLKKAAKKKWTSRSDNCAKAAQRLIQKIQQLSRPAETTISKHLEKTI